MAILRLLNHRSRAHPVSLAVQAALPAEVFQGFVAALKPKQQQRLQEVLSA